MQSGPAASAYFSWMTVMRMLTLTFTNVCDCSNVLHSPAATTGQPFTLSNSHNPSKKSWRPPFPLRLWGGTSHKTHQMLSVTWYRSVSRAMYGGRKAGRKTFSASDDAGFEARVVGWGATSSFVISAALLSPRTMLAPAEPPRVVNERAGAIHSACSTRSTAGSRMALSNAHTRTRTVSNLLDLVTPCLSLDKGRVRGL